MKNRLFGLVGKSALATVVAGAVLAFSSPVAALAAGRGGGGHAGGGFSAGGHAFSGGPQFSGGGASEVAGDMMAATRGGAAYRGGYYRGGGYGGGLYLGLGVPYGYGYGYAPARHAASMTKPAFGIPRLVPSAATVIEPAPRRPVTRPASRRHWCRGCGGRRRAARRGSG